MKSMARRILLIAAAVVPLACAPMASLMAKTAPAGTRFNDDGKVTFHRGQPCTSQIMFDFHPGRSKAVVWLAADARDSKKLSEAARGHDRVRISGIWKRGRETGCGYVDVSKVAVQTSFWSRLFKP
jgi:hypothetical protein